MKGTSFHIKNMYRKQLCNHNIRDFAMALPARKASGAFEKRAPGLGHRVVFLGKILYSHSASLHTGIQIGNGEFNAGGKRAMD